MKAISITSTQIYYKKDYSETPLVEVLINIIKSVEGPGKCPLDQRELAFNIIAYLSSDFRPHQKEFRRKGGIELIK